MLISSAAEDERLNVGLKTVRVKPFRSWESKRVCFRDITIDES